MTDKPIHQSLARFSLDRCSELIFWVRADGSFAYTNPAVHRALGYGAEELASLTAQDILHDYDGEDRVALRAEIDGCECRIIRATLRRKDGSLLPVEARNHTHTVGGETFNCAVSRPLDFSHLAGRVATSARAKSAAPPPLYELTDRLGIIGTARPLVAALELAYAYARNHESILITGESGTGKEQLAQLIHAASARRDRNMLSINCGALPVETICSELFGHRKGAFTGADSAHEGLFASSNGTTLFLDEIGELPLSVQATLLRVLQNGQYCRMGENEVRRTDVRLIAATNRDLEQMVTAGTFRSDLYYRIKVLRVDLPPLRERRGDILPLVRHQLALLNGEGGTNIAEPTEEDLNCLREHPLPGNIRELFAIVKRAYYRTRGPRINLAHLRANLDALVTTGEPVDAHLTLDAFLRQHIIRALIRSNGQVGGAAGAAASLGVKRSTLRARMARLGIDAGSYARKDPSLPRRSAAAD